MIRKLVRQMLTAQIFSALTVSLCLLIDNIMIGRFLGVQSLAAYSAANPVLLVIGALGTMLGAGVQVVCSRSLGKGSQEETNAGYSAAIALTLGFSLAFMVLVLLLRAPIATAMGAGSEGELFIQTKDYMAGFIIGAPASMGALVLVPFLQMAGQSTLLIVAVLSMTVADVALDLLNVLVFHGGMFGMGLASSLSYYIALVISLIYFLSRKCVFRFSRRLITRAKIAELFKSGMPAVFGMASSVVLVFAMNRLLKGINGETAMAAFAVISSIGNAACCINTGVGGVSLTLAGIFYNEEDRSSLKELMALLFRYAVVLGLGMGAVLVFGAPLFAGLFISEKGPAQEMAILGLRMYAGGLIACCINNALKNAYQATGRVGLTEILSLAEGAILPTVVALIFGLTLGTTGAWLYFPLGEILTLVCIGLLVWRKTRQAPWKDGAYLLLKQDFGVTADNLMEADIYTMEEVADVSEKARQFCLSHGQSAKVSSHIALCIEEMASNTIQHGFSQDGKKHHLSVRILHKKEDWVLRFRDDCGAFDPVHYVPEGDQDALGIRLVRAMAREASYTYSLNLNNLALKLNAEE